MERLNGVKGWCQKTTVITDDYIQLIWERCTLSAQSQRKGRKMGHSSKARSCHSLLMKAAEVYIRKKTLTRFEIIPL